MGQRTHFLCSNNEIASAKEWFEASNANPGKTSERLVEQLHILCAILVDPEDLLMEFVGQQ